MSRRSGNRRALTAASPGLLGLLGLLGILTIAACSQAQDSTAEPAADAAEELTITGGEAFHGLLEYRARDAKLALVRPTFVTSAQAGLASGVSVVGVSLGGIHRAYPLYVLKNHQIVNDTLGGVPIAASW